MICMEKQTNKTPCNECGLILAQHKKAILKRKKIWIHDYVPHIPDFGGLIEEEQIQIDIANAGYSNYSLQ